MLNLYNNDNFIKNYFFKNNFFNYKITSFCRRNIFWSASASDLYRNKVVKNSNFITINKMYNSNVLLKVRLYSSISSTRTSINLNELEHLSQIFFDRYSDRINMKTFYAKLQKKYVTKIYFFDSAINFGGKTFFIKYSSLLLKNINNQFFINIWKSTNFEGNKNNKLIGLNLNSKIHDSFFKKWIFYFTSFFKTREPFLISFCKKRVKKRRKWKVSFKKRKKLVFFANYVKFLSNLNQVKYFRILFNDIFYAKNFFYDNQVISSDFLLFFDQNFKNISNFLNNFLSNYILFEKYLLFFISQKNLFFLFNGNGKYQINSIIPKFKTISLVSYKNLEMFFNSYRSSLILDEQKEKPWFDFLNGKLEIMDNQLYFNNKTKDYNFFWKYKKKKRINLLHLKSAFIPNRHFFWRSNISLFFGSFPFSELRSLPSNIKKFSSKFLKKNGFKNKKRKVNFFAKGRNFITNFFNNKFFHEKVKQRLNILKFARRSLWLGLVLGTKKLSTLVDFLDRRPKYNYPTNIISENLVRRSKLKRNFFRSKIYFKYFYLKKYKRLVTKESSSLNIFSKVLLTSHVSKNNFFKNPLPVFKMRIFEKLKKKYFRKFFEIGTRVFTLFKRRFIKSKFYKPLMSFLGNLKKKWLFVYKNLKIMLVNFFLKKENGSYSYFNFSLKTIYFYILFIGLHFFFKFNNFISFFNSLKIKMISNLEKKKSYIAKIFSSVKFIKKKLFKFNFNEEIKNGLIKYPAIFLNNFFLKSNSIFFFQAFSFINGENLKRYLDFLKDKIYSFLISPNVMLLFNYKYNEAIFLDNTKNKSSNNLFNSIKKILLKNYNLAFSNQMPKELFSHASQYIKKFNYFHSKKILDKKRKIYRMKKKKKRLKLFRNKKFNKRQKNKLLYFKRKKRQEKKIVLNKKIIFVNNFKKLGIPYHSISKKENFIKKKRTSYLGKKFLRKFLNKLLKIHNIKNKIKKFRLKKFIYFIPRIDYKINPNSLKLFNSVNLVDNKNTKFIKRFKSYQGKKGVRKMIFNNNDKRSKIAKKRLSRFFLFNQLNSSPKSLYRFSYYTYNFSKKFLSNLRRGLLNNLLKFDSADLKIEVPQYDYILKDGIFHKTEIPINSSMLEYLSALLKLYKIWFFSDRSFSKKTTVATITNNLYSFVMNNRFIFDNIDKNVKFFYKENYFFSKYIGFFKNIFYNFYSNSKNIKKYFLTKYLLMRNIKLRKKKEILQSVKNQGNKRNLLILRKSNITSRFIRRFLKKKRIKRRKNVDFFLVKNRIYTNIFKTLSNAKIFFRLNKLKNLNKKYFWGKKIRKIGIKRTFIDILPLLLNMKILNFENAIGIYQLLKSFNFLALKKDNLVNGFLMFFTSNKTNLYEDRASANSKYFFNNLGLLFNNVFSKLCMLDKNKIKIDWIMLNKIFLNFFTVLKNEMLKFKNITKLNNNLEILFIFFLLNALSFILGLFLKNKSLNSFQVNFNLYKFILLKNKQSDKMFEYFSNMWDFFLKNFPFYLVIGNRKIINRSKGKSLTSISEPVKGNLNIFSINKTILKFHEYSKIIFNKMRESIGKTKVKAITVFAENFIKNKYKNFFFLIIKATKNNIFFTFLNRKGRLIKKGSGGMLGYEGPKRTTHLAASDNIKNIVSNIILKYKIRKKYKYKHKYTQKYSYIRKRKVTTKSEKKRQIFLSIIKSFFFNVITILRSSPKNMQIKAVLESLYTSGCKIIRVLNYAARSHNGCRKKKVRRL